jgi:hypothetical protein
MKASLFLLLSSVVCALEYGALKEVLARSPVQSLRLTEIEAKVNAGGPMDQVGSLCYQTLKEIDTEINVLQTTHEAFVKENEQLMTRWSASRNRNARCISRSMAYSSRYYKCWNNWLKKIPHYRRAKDRWTQRAQAIEKAVTRRNEFRARQHQEYLNDMNDFNVALNDLDTIKNILVKSTAFDSTTGANTAAQGFLQTTATNDYLQAVGEVKSQHFRNMQHRLLRGARFLQEEVTSEEQQSGIDKLLNLLFKVRNELWREMDKLTKLENKRALDHKNWLLLTQYHFNRSQMYRSVYYYHIANALVQRGRCGRQEAYYNCREVACRKANAFIDINMMFQKDVANAEGPKYQKLRTNKLAEIKTINMMIKILRNLKWSGAVYAAIARISVDGANENPEPGYNLGYQLDASVGMPVNGRVVYNIQGRDIKDFGRVAVKLEIGNAWVWASFDAFSATSKVTEYLMPSKTNGLVQQRKVKNLHVFGSASQTKAGLVEGNSDEGNVEIWANTYSPKNAKKIPNAQDGAYDWGDQRGTRGFHGCFQVHDFMNKQVLVAVNELFIPNKHAVGLGNQKSANGKFVHPDWTHAKNFEALKRQKKKVILTWYFQPKGYTDIHKTQSPTPQAVNNNSKCVLKCPANHKLVHPACQCVANTCTKTCKSGEMLVAPCDCKALPPSAPPTHAPPTPPPKTGF